MSQFTTTQPSDIVATLDLTAQGANIGATTLYTPVADGFYRVNFICNVTQAAATSSTLPGGQVRWTDATTNVTQTISVTGTNTANTVGTQGQVSGFLVGNGVLHAKAGTPIQYATSGFASSGAPAMQYALRIRLQYISS